MSTLFLLLGILLMQVGLSGLDSEKYKTIGGLTFTIGGAMSLLVILAWIGQHFN